jgi:hypothetical protein
MQPDSAPHPVFPDEFYKDPTGIDRYVVQEKKLIEWQAPAKLPAPPLPKIGAALVVLLAGTAVVLWLSGDVMLLPLVVVVALVYNVVIHRQTTAIACQVTTLGLKVEEKYYYWSQLIQYWIEIRQGMPALFVRNVVGYPETIKLLLDDALLDGVMHAMGTYLLYKEPQHTWWRRFIKFLRSLLPFDVEFL